MNESRRKSNKIYMRINYIEKLRFLKCCSKETIKDVERDILINRVAFNKKTFVNNIVDITNTLLLVEGRCDKKC